MIGDFIVRFRDSPLAAFSGPPWGITSGAGVYVRAILDRLGSGYWIEGDRAVHETAQVEQGAVLKGPVIIGPGTVIAAGAYLRAGVFLDEACIVGPGCEVKSSFLFRGSKIAHLSFVGDSVIGEHVNIEAGVVIANHRNEFADKRIRIRRGDDVIETGVEKFGALIGDRACIGANAVLAPRALIDPGQVVPRLGLVDQHPDA